MFLCRFCVIMWWVMKMEIEKPRRKKNRLENYDYSSCGAYFITVCTLERRNYFWKNVGAIIDRPQDVELSPYGEIVNEAISNISSVYPTLSFEGYVIMPNHIHILLRICADGCGGTVVAPPMSQVVKQLKRCFSQQVGTTTLPKPFPNPTLPNHQDY